MYWRQRSASHLCLAVPDAAAEETPRLRAWWALQQRAYPLGYIPEGAHMRALRQMRAARAARSATAGGGAGADSERWINIGPAPMTNPFGVAMSGRVAAVAVDPRNAQRWLIGAAQGGIWETRDGGTTWTPKTDGAASLAMGAIAFAPGDPDVVYAGTGEFVYGGNSYGGAGLLKSIDAGATWQLLAASTFAGTSFSAPQVDPNDAGNVMAATHAGFFGRTSFWTNPPPSPPPSGILKSSDGGTIWSNKLIGRASALVVDRGNFTRQFAAIGAFYCVDGPPLPCVGPDLPDAVQNGLYRSTDAGDSWTLLGGPWDSAAGKVGRMMLALAPSDPNVLYVSIHDANNEQGEGFLGLWKTTNAWDAMPSWTQIDVKATDDGSGVHGYCGWNPATSRPKGQCWYAHTLLVDQTDPDVLYAGGVPLWRFDGTTWTQISKIAIDPFHAIHADQHAMAWAGERLIVGNDGGVWSTTDNGTTWSDHNTNLAITQFFKGALHPTNPNFALGGSQDNGIEKWTGADTWQNFLGGDGFDMAISASQPDTHWALAIQGLRIYRSISNNTRLAGEGIDLTAAPFGGRFEQCPVNEDVFIAGTDNLWRTTNFFSAPPVPGPTWSANGPEMGERNFQSISTLDFSGCITALGFAASDATCQTYAFATGDGRLLRTTNGGNTWDDLDASNQVPNRYVTDLAFAPTDANILYVTLSGFDEGTPGQPGHVFKTASALAAAPVWLDVSPPVNQSQNAIAVDPVDPQIVYLGADTGVWESRDGARTWTPMGPETGMPNVAVFDLEVHATTRRPFAFTFGRGAFVLACRSDPDCEDQDAGNGAERCDLVSGRCQKALPTATATPTVTRTATPSATPSPTPIVCTGDCDGNDMVAVNELVLGVNIVLDVKPLTACPAFANSQGRVDIAQLVTGVNNALHGCGG